MAKGAKNGPGQACVMRAWMREQKRPFTRMRVCLGLGASVGLERAKVGSAIRDFLQRGEVEIATPGRCKKPAKYRYNSKYKRNKKSPLRQKIYKAMYVSGRFTIADIQRLTEQDDRSYIDRICRRLRGAGWIQQAGCSRCAHRPVVEKVWRIVNAARFRVEVME